jgi:solute carrier family 6 GABA transporter-like protein 1
MHRGQPNPSRSQRHHRPRRELEDTPFLPFLLRYISGPVLAMIFSFAVPESHTLRYNPMMIARFIISILTIGVVLVGFVTPR